jgi:hypothetical protein
MGEEENLSTWGQVCDISDCHVPTCCSSLPDAFCPETVSSAVPHSTHSSFAAWEEEGGRGDGRDGRK